MFDLSKWGINNLLEDFIQKPIIITIDNLSEKYVIKGTFQVLKKGDKDGKGNISKGVRQDQKRSDTKLAKVSTKKRGRTNLTTDR